MALTADSIKEKWAPIAIGIGVIWFVIGQVQQARDLLVDAPQLLRALGSPWAGAVTVVLSLLVYVYLQLASAFSSTEAGQVASIGESKDPLVGKWFHTTTDGDLIQYQGQILSKADGRYLGQLYSFETGDPTIQRLLTANEIETGRFYDSNEIMNEEYEKAMRIWSRRQEAERRQKKN